MYRIIRLPIAAFVLQYVYRIFSTDHDPLGVRHTLNLRRKVVGIVAFVERLLCIFWGVLLLLCATSAVAETYFVDPNVAGQEGGTAQDPWINLEAALTSGQIRGGDVIMLAAGEYGALDLVGAQFEQAVTIRGPEVGTAHFEYIYLRNAQHLTFERISVWPTAPTEMSHLVRAEPNTAHIILRNMDIRSAENAENYPTWTLADWEDTKFSGIFLRGPASRAEGNTLTGLYLALTTTAPDAVVANNKIRGFSADGIRALGDRSVISGNLVQDCVQIDNNHADGFQSWSIGDDNRPGSGVVTGLEIRSNIIFEWISPLRPDFACSLQGIGMFDGMFRDTVIENNIISVTSYHGIALTGGLDTRIMHNTVINSSVPGADRPWIGLFPHKDGRPSVGAVIANNIAPNLQMPEMDTSTVDAIQNLIAPYPGRHLQAPYRWDFTPLEGSGAHDTGALNFGPPAGVFGTLRPQGTAPDIGAVERP